MDKSDHLTIVRISRADLTGSSALMPIPNLRWWQFIALAKNYSASIFCGLLAATYLSIDGIVARE